jgi:tight adherence protein C
MAPFVLFIILGACWYVVVAPAQGGAAEDTSRQWDLARDGLSNPIDRALHAVARPLQGNAVLYGRATSPAYRTVQAKLLASGGLYGGSVEVFLGAQVVSIVLGAIGLSLAMTLEVSTGQMVAFLVGSLGLAGWPIGQVNKISKKRTAEINTTLPAFADLLQMPLSAGMGVLPAIAFTTERTRPGVVKTELENMLSLQKSRAVPDAQVFMIAGERLGTPEAKSFFTALMQAHTQGMRVVENIEHQAEGLRSKAYEIRRTEIKKLGNAISAKVALFFMPGLLIVTMFPVVYGLGKL